MPTIEASNRISGACTEIKLEQVHKRLSGDAMTVQFDKARDLIIAGVGTNLELRLFSNPLELGKRVNLGSICLFAMEQIGCCVLVVSR